MTERNRRTKTTRENNARIRVEKTVQKQVETELVKKKEVAKIEFSQRQRAVITAFSP
jgi:transposase-like protein